MLYETMENMRGGMIVRIIFRVMLSCYQYHPRILFGTQRMKMRMRRGQVHLSL